MLALVALLLLASALWGCGGGSKSSSITVGSTTTSPTTTVASSATLSPAQRQNERRLTRYVAAQKDVMAPFNHTTRTYAELTSRIRAAIRKLAALTPPPAFQASHAQFLKGLAGQLKVIAKHEQGARTHNIELLYSAQAEGVHNKATIRAAVAESAAALALCRRQNFSC
jgi:hypothetical protein